MHTSAATRLRASGLRVTRPRLAVLAVLDAAAEHEHLAVSQVADRARLAIGTLSKQATYDCLEVLTSARLVRRVEPAGHPARYEGRVGDNHHHLVCRSCGVTADVDCASGSATCLAPSDAKGFAIDEAEVVFWGTCPACTEPARAAAGAVPRAASYGTAPN